MTTFAEMITELAENMTVTGVKTTLDYDPLSYPGTADYPLSHPRLPNGNKGEVISHCFDRGSDKTLEVVYVVSPAGQGTGKSNFDATVSMADNVLTAIATKKKAFSGHVLTYSLTTDTPVNRDDIDHYAVILAATISKL